LIPKDGEWKLEPGDLWFQGNQNDNGPYRFDGKSLHRLEFPKHELESRFYSLFPGGDRGRRLQIQRDGLSEVQALKSWPR
jgi:hypothetical protein